MIVGTSDKIWIEWRRIQQMENIFGSTININREGNAKDEINERIKKFGILIIAINSEIRKYPRKWKGDVIRKIVNPTLSFRCETFTITETEKQNKINRHENEGIEENRR